MATLATVTAAVGSIIPHLHGPAPGLHREAGWELSPASCDGCKGCGTVCCGKRSRGRKIIPRIKPVSLQKCWPSWAEARPGKASCVVSSVRTCCHALCAWGFLCFTRSVPSECHTAALGHSLLLFPVPELQRGLLPPLGTVPGCQQVLLHQWVMPESLVPVPGTASLLPGNTATFLADTMRLAKKDRWDISVHLFPARFPSH